MKKKAFTLIELLIVIAIIAMLISIIVPTARTIKTQARMVVCSSNLSQIATSFAMYDHENGTFPHGFDDLSNVSGEPPGGYVGTAANDKSGWWWFHHIMKSDYSKDSIFWCPSRNIPELPEKKNILCGNYGVNRSICKDAPRLTGVIGNEFVGKSLAASQVRNPSQTLLIADSGYSLVSWKAANDAASPHFDNTFRENSFYIPGILINKTRPLNLNATPQAVLGRHPKRKVNTTYSDGHISSIKADMLTVEKIGSSYKNLSLWIGK